LLSIKKMQNKITCVVNSCASVVGNEAAMISSAVHVSILRLLASRNALSVLQVITKPFGTGTTQYQYKSWRNFIYKPNTCTRFLQILEYSYYKLFTKNATRTQRTHKKHATQRRSRNKVQHERTNTQEQEQPCKNKNKHARTRTNTQEQEQPRKNKNNHARTRTTTQE
jgi:hypothetical protein